MKKEVVRCVNILIASFFVRSDAEKLSAAGSFPFYSCDMLLCAF